MSLLPTQPCKGTRDFLPEEMSVRTQIFQKLFNTVELFGFQRYDSPILESAAIYEAKSGEEIANQQMYRLFDKGGRELALRPEMTPSVARIVAGHQNEIIFPARWYCHANCFRYERPQRGRVREHWQLNVDIFGSEDINAEVEIFDLIAALLSGLGANESMYVIRVNDRVLVQAALSNYIGLSPDKIAATSKVIDRWEKITDENRYELLNEIGLSDNQVERLQQLVGLDLDSYCEAAGKEAAAQSRIAKIIREGSSIAPLNFDPIIVRGFDYYTSTVFEVFDKSPENRRSLFGGGRYDNLAGLFTDRKIPGIGFGMGDVTTWNFLKHNDLLPKPEIGSDVLVFATSEEYRTTVRRIVRLLRNAGIKTEPSLENLSIKHGMKLADRLGVNYTVIIGENEHDSGSLSLKNMVNSVQINTSESEIIKLIKEKSV
ncbi:MAG TPA: histidine--tRNA ligase [Pyrinomonadaceae bacterium]|jgi:histidyl-tRNA synthetase